MRCGLLGEHLAHSYSPQIHQMLGSYTYELFEVSPKALDAFLRGGAFDALNVTIPYKRAVLAYCAALSDRAKRIGSVNTLLRRSDGSLYGENTDYDGFAYLLAKNGGIAAGEKAIVLGDGGSSRTVQTLLEDLGARVVVLSRKGENGFAAISQHKDASLVVNTTPVGMFPNNGERLIDPLPQCRLVLDLIYNPARTQLLLDAEAHGIACEGGLPMLVAQAKRAAELFTQQSIPDRKIEEILQILSRQMENIVLIGMPGCGKSTVGAALAKLLGRTFIDADDVLAEKAACSIPEFFARNGEEAFRALETQVLKELGKRSSCVIATGGGCVTREENFAHLHQNSRIVWLQRDIAALPTQGRPLSQANSLQALFASRKAAYARFADIQVVNQGSAEETAVAIMDIM
ncbi:MAG: shikimate kinase [Oscillospiraceae bacterium]|jgi:shikimate dehydrogenase|nr:shikimate kinase [Oscillospiraceae bacterium]